MTIASYSDLQSALGTWAHRVDLSSIAPDLITLAEARMNDMLILRDMEIESTIATVIGNNYVALPAGYLSPIAMWLLVTSGSQTIRQLLKPALPEELPYYPNQTQPRYWAIDGDNIRFDCPADAIYSTAFRFVQKSNLSNAVTTNYLLAQRPDIYLSGCMVELGRYLDDTDMQATWEPKFKQACAEFKARENRNRDVAPLRVDPALVTPKRDAYNIYRG